MKRKIPLLTILVLIGTSALFAQKQKKDSTRTIQLRELQVTGVRTVNGTGHHNEVNEQIIYAGKKNEVIVIDSIDANKAINNTRQIIGRIPGLNIVETESGGFTANGIGFRGLNPIQSIEVNLRQNGYNISGDVYGYNEAYYVPPMEAVDRVETIRGAAGLQFGAQFGGLVNYVIKQAPKNQSFELTTSQTGGSYGLFNSFNSIGGTVGKWNYYGFVQYRRLQGWRPNSEQTQVSGYGKIGYQATQRLSLGLEYSLLRNRIQMPGGLTDEQFAANSKASYRARNWLTSPWNILTASLNYKISDRTSLDLKSTFLLGERKLVWRNEDGGPAMMDEIDPATNRYVPREVERSEMQSNATELRLLTNYSLGSHTSTLGAGIRVAYAKFHRQGGGEGTTGTDFDLRLVGDKYAKDIRFTTANFAPFIENIFRLSNRLTVTPGIRLEYLRSTAKGYVTKAGVELPIDTAKIRSFILWGIGAQYKLTGNTNLYANISQSYRPIDYAQLSPFGVTSRIDPNMKDASGYQIDMGYRGTIKNILNFDLGAFYLAYDNRIGIVEKTDKNGNTYTLRTNVANSIHKGIEEYLELNLVKWLAPEVHANLSIFNSLAVVDARYTTGEYKGKQVEYAPRFINRLGLIYACNGFSTTFAFSQQSKSYGDASNVEKGSNNDPVVGAIPAYEVMDWSATYKWKRYSIKGGVNNLADKRYFTFRTDEYPGPGIIPAVGRSFYFGISAAF